MLAFAKKVLWKARNGGYAVGAFNTSNLETSKAIISAAEELNAPVIIQTSPSAITYAGMENISQILQTLASRAKVPVIIHLDHGTELRMARECIRHGYTSIMIDASALPFEQNVKMVKSVKRMSWWRGVQVEAELGRIQGIEDKVHVSKEESFYTDPQQAKKFVKLTKCDSLAIAIGTAHGAFKFKQKDAGLRLDLLKEINDLCNIPLVLHGASAVMQEEVKMINKYGGRVLGAHGVDEPTIREAIKGGICKINTDTDLRLAFTAALRQTLAKNREFIDPRKILGPSSEEIKSVVMSRIKLFGSEGKA